MKNISITKRVDNLIKSFKELFEQTGAKSVILGLSGGIDSSVAATLVVEALGKDLVFPYFLPYSTSSKSSLEDALKISDFLDLNLKILDISKSVDAIVETSESINKVRKGNIMARVRMITLFDNAHRLSGVVLGTSNRTEILLGYGTLYGDTASSINILGGLYKCDVYKISDHLNIPKSIKMKAPTGDLWPDQTDELELGFTYEQIDLFFKLVLEDKVNYSTLVETFGKDFVKKASIRVLDNLFKSKMPPICNDGIDYSSMKDFYNIFQNIKDRMIGLEEVDEIF